MLWQCSPEIFTGGLETGAKGSGVNNLQQKLVIAWFLQTACFPSTPPIFVPIKYQLGLQILIIALSNWEDLGGAANRQLDVSVSQFIR